MGAAGPKLGWFRHRLSREKAVSAGGGSIVLVVVLTAAAIAGGVLLADSLAYVSKAPPKDALVHIGGPGVVTPWVHWNLDKKELLLGGAVCAAACLIALFRAKSRLRYLPLAAAVVLLAVGLTGAIEIRQPVFFTDNTELVEFDSYSKPVSYEFIRSRYVRTHDLENATLFPMPGHVERLVGVREQWEAD